VINTNNNQRTRELRVEKLGERRGEKKNPRWCSQGGVKALTPQKKKKSPIPREGEPEEPSIWGGRGQSYWEGEKIKEPSLQGGQGLEKRGEAISDAKTLMWCPSGCRERGKPQPQPVENSQRRHTRDGGQPEQEQEKASKKISIFI